MNSKNKTEEERFIDELIHYAHIWQYETECMTEDSAFDAGYDKAANNCGEAIEHLLRRYGKIQ